MKNLTLFLGGILLSATTFAQSIEFTLNKALTVGCGSSNPLTDMTKKVDVVLEGNKGTLTYASINCKKTIEGMNMGVVNQSTQGTAYLDEREKKGFIVEKNEKVILFTHKDGKYVAFGAGHIDKKLAKTLNPESDQAAYADFFANIDKLMAEAKQKAKDAAKIANTLPVPTGNFSDESGISGTYYLSSLQKVTNIEQYVQAVNLEFKKDIPELNIHYKDGGVIKAYMHEIFLKSFRAGNVDANNVYFECEFYYDLEVFSRTRLYPLEKGLYLVTLGSSFGSKLDCSEPYMSEKKGDDGKPFFMLLGKDKERINYLLAHQEELIQLGKDGYVKVCETMNAIEAAKRPMPAPGMKDAKLQAEITAVVKAKAEAAGWAQTVVYAYPKSSEWFTIRNNATGIITGRSIRAIAVLKTNAGKCQWEEVSINQNFDGANYGKSYFSGNTSIIVPVECVESMKYIK